MNVCGFTQADILKASNTKYKCFIHVDKNVETISLLALSVIAVRKLTHQ